ncbi:MAG: hypothetical protein PUP93_03525 [Rhizonema sp. NSF051]|nr:hypothetical protein [Rhizonema sp. NSF051]
MKTSKKYIHFSWKKIMSTHLNFVTSTIAATTTVAISAVSFFSMNPAMAATKVHAVGTCDAFNDAGKVVGKVLPGDYQLIRHVTFKNGLHGSKILGNFVIAGLHTVNVYNDCLQLSGNRVIERH